MTARSVPSLKKLAQESSPLADLSQLTKALRRATSETRFLEWKAYPPTGPTVSVSAKYRMVRAAISFANTDGGFIVFGVGRDGSWKGLSSDEIKHIDISKVYELINSCVSPEIEGLECAFPTVGKKSFVVLHVPRSPVAPHVTTKEIIDRTASDKRSVIIEKYCLYYRSAGRSARATPSQHQKIAVRRAESFRADMLRRVREVPIPTPGASPDVIHPAQIVTARITSDKDAPEFRLTRESGKAEGVILYEQVSDLLFEEVNNILDANWVLAKGKTLFLLGEPVYYDIYGKRHHVVGRENHNLLARAGLVDIYGPHLFWYTLLTPKEVAELFAKMLHEAKSPSIHALNKFAALAGQDVSEWFWKVFDGYWKDRPRKPDYYYSMKENRKHPKTGDARLVALRVKERKSIAVPTSDRLMTVGDLIAQPDVCRDLLTGCCKEILNGRTDLRDSARTLDVLAYGLEIRQKGQEVYSELLKLGPVSRQRT